MQTRYRILLGVLVGLGLAVVISFLALGVGKILVDIGKSPAQLIAEDQVWIEPLAGKDIPAKRTEVDMGGVSNGFWSARVTQTDKMTMEVSFIDTAQQVFMKFILVCSSSCRSLVSVPFWRGGGWTQEYPANAPFKATFPVGKQIWVVIFGKSEGKFYIAFPEE